MSKEQKIVIHADTTDPATWGLYSFEMLPNRHDAEPLPPIEVTKYILVMGASLAIYFAFCFAI